MFVILQGDADTVRWRGGCTGLGFERVEHHIIGTSTHADHFARPRRSVPHAGSAVKRLCLLVAGCRKRRQNQALSVLLA